MTKNLAHGIQSQAQAPSLVDLPEPPIDIDAPVEVIDKPQRSASAKRSRSPDQTQTHSVSKCAKSTTATSKRSLSHERDYPRGTRRVTKPTLSSPIKIEDRPIQARDLANLKTDMTSLIQDMIQSSLGSFASQFKDSFGSKGDSSQNRAHEISRDQDQDQDEDPSQGQVDQVDQVDPSGGSGGSSRRGGRRVGL